MNTHKLLGTVLLALLGLLIADVAFAPFMTDNGDFYRVTREAIRSTPWAVEPFQCPLIEPNQHPPLSSMGVVFNVIVRSAHAMGIHCIDLRMYGLVLAAVFTIGAIGAAAFDKRNLMPLIGTTLVALMLSPFISSFYEEAVILPLVPWLMLAHSLMKINYSSLPYIALASGIVFAKSQMVLLIPFFSYLLLRTRKDGYIGSHTMAMGFLVLIAAGAAANYAKASNALPNAYNRLLNGIGWSLLDVTTWPASNFNERNEFFHVNKNNFKLYHASALPPVLQPLVGTAYWPEGIRFLGPDATTPPPPGLLETLKPTFYLKALLSIEILTPLIKSTYHLALTSDYSMAYLVQRPKHPWWAAYASNKAAVTMRLGFFFAVVVAWFLISRRGWSAGLGAGTFLAMPLLVVVGDGFYEFEKHMIPYFMVVPLFFLLPRRADDSPSSRSARTRLTSPNL